MKETLRINNVSHRYNGSNVLEGVSFSVSMGGFLGVIGPNGAGKSTLLKVISRSIKPDTGEVLLDGRPICEMKRRETARRIAFVPEETVVNFSFTCRDIVLMGRTPYINRFSWEGNEDYRKVEEAMKLTDTLKFKARDINDLSSGEKQRVIIARALAQEPDILLLDEPTSHLDISHQKVILDLIRKLNRDNNLTIITVMHDINLAALYCEELLFLNNGKIYMKGSPQELITENNIREVYGTDVQISRDNKTGLPGVIIIPGGNK